MKLTITKTFDFAHRGCDVVRYEKGQEVDTDDADLIATCKAENWAKPSGKAAAEAAAKAKEEAEAKTKAEAAAKAEQEAEAKAKEEADNKSAGNAPENKAA